MQYQVRLDRAFQYFGNARLAYEQKRYHGSIQKRHN